MEEKILIFIIVGAILLYIVQVFTTYNILTFWREELVPKNMVLQGGKRKRRNSRIKKRSN
jgi:hypothetical protein